MLMQSGRDAQALRVGKFTVRRGVPATALQIRVLRCRAVFLSPGECLS